MSRHRSLFASLAAANRMYERQQRARIRAEQQAARRHVQALKAAERTQKLELKEQADAYREERQEEAKQLTADAEARFEQLRTLLTTPPHAVIYGRYDGRLSPETVVVRAFASRKQTHTPTAFNPESTVGPLPSRPDPKHFAPTLPPKPGFFGRLFGGQAKYEIAVSEATESAQTRFVQAGDIYSKDLVAWEAREAAGRAVHLASEQKRADVVRQHNENVDRWEKALKERDQDAVVQYVSLVLDSSEYGDDIPEEFRVAYSPDSREVVLEWVLPTIEVVPFVKEYTYTRAKDEIREKARPRAEITSLYRTVIAALTLRTIGELLHALPDDLLTTVTFNGILATVDPATGKDVRPCVISVRTTRTAFTSLELGRVDPAACLGSLGASVSKKPEELAPVRPVIEFDMADRRFVPSEDAISELDTRSNIMDLTPFEFENLVTNLFSKMGLDAKQTRSSRDGGVDCVAFDSRPVLGGKVVIQAKRYKNTVGVSAVRDLFGTMMNEGANKGILVTTAGYGPDAHDFAKDKPIELIDGGGLLYLLDQNGVQARIIMPA
jgi:restriction system protein